MRAFKPLCVVICCVALLAAAFFLGRNSISSDAISHNRDLTQTGTKYKFISPLLECGDYQASNLLNADASEIKGKLSDYIQSKKDAGLVNNVAVYFRDLSNGPYVNIDANQKFIPGSLLKVPVAISVYKQAEDNPRILTSSRVFPLGSTDLDVEQHFKPEQSIKPGGRYSLEDLIQYMLLYSDNNAAVLAVNFLDSAKLIASYSDLGLTAPITAAGQYTLTVKDYASFFRILYNASYLNQAYSEHLLETLSKTKFNDGLVAGVPPTVVVSHKFGEKGTDDGKVQLHDCGVIYKPGQPYVLCVMTQGSDFDVLTSIISDISTMVYKALEAN